jgi:serine/threonine-protein kinase
MHSSGEPVADAPGDEPQAAAPRSERTPQRARRCPTCKQTFSGDARFCPFDGGGLIDAPDWNPGADPLLGRIIEGRYEVLSLVGEGGMGTVYEVRHTTLGRVFAMKVLRRDIAKDPELVARFGQEAKAAAAIGHPNIVTVSDFGSIEIGSKEPARPYFVMELLEGTSLGALLRAEKTVPPSRIAPFFVQCATALEAAHRAGVIHRDLKPDNIFIVKKGEQEFVKLLDFGVAKIAGSRRLTRVGMVFGTPHYMSPEQAEGKRVDARTDIYALGVIMYESFSGRVPFEADTYMGVLTKHMFAVPEPLERVVPDASKLGAFGPIVMRCLAKRPEDRYASMAELSAALELALTNPPKAAAAGIADDRPRREALRLRDRDQMHGRVDVPANVREPLPAWARATIAIAALAFPIAVAFGFRAWRAGGAAEATPEQTAGDAPAAARSGAPLGAGPDAVATPGAVTTAGATAAPAAAPTGRAAVIPQGQPADVRSASAAASSTAPVTPPLPPGRSSAQPKPSATGTSEVVDPWKR